MLQATGTACRPVFLYIALGSNLSSSYGTPKENVLTALARLREAGLSPSAESRHYATPCFPAGVGPEYVNAVVEVQSALPPRDVLTILHRIETTLDRERKDRWGARTLDLDLLAYGDLILPDMPTYRRWAELSAERQRQTAPDQLILPHPRLHERAFVLVPLAEIAPAWRHPVLGQTSSELLAALPTEERAEIRPI